MHYFTWVLFILFFISSDVIAQEQGHDPFYPTQSQPKTTLSPVVTTLSNEQFCPQSKEGLANDSPFEQLKIVGVIQRKKGGKVLFINDKNELIVAQDGDFISQNRWQIIKITLNKISFIKWLWSEKCQKSQIMTKQF